MTTFPKDFVWGTGTASYQIEGAWNEDGRGESIWDRFSHTPGRTANGDTGDVACDHYHRWRDDVALMKQLGVNAYRFSVAWPRVLPQGRGAINAKGLDFYDRLVDALLAAGIQPYITLYHWDLPQALDDAGGWLNRDIAGAFADYTAVVVRRLGDRVKSWMTINEPYCVAFLGYREGVHAPGRRDERLALQAGHHTLLAHGRAVQAIRALSSGAQVGIVANLWTVDPLRDDDEEDRSLAELQWQKDCAWFLDPVFKARYPDRAWAAYGSIAPSVDDGDFEIISQPIDYLGVNYYFRALFDRGRRIAGLPNAEYTDMGWEVHAPGLTAVLLKLHHDYPGVALSVTENGAAYKDTLTPDGVHDPRRINYLCEHIDAVGRAIEAGADVRGYFVWTFLDNFEWAYGYDKRFGLVYVDYPTQRRVPKDSFYWYAQTIARRGLA